MRTGRTAEASPATSQADERADSNDTPESVVRQPSCASMPDATRSEDAAQQDVTQRPARFRRAVGQITAVNVGVLLAGFITGPIQARALGPSGRGELAAIIVPVTLAPFIFGLGLDSYVARAAARRSGVGRAVGSSALLAIGAGLVCA